MERFLTKKNIIVGVSVIVLLFLVFALFRPKSDAETPAIIMIEAGSVDLILGRELLKTLADLKSTNLDITFLSNPLFTGLHDFGVIIERQPVGRRNPFDAFEKTSSTKRPATVPAGGSKKAGGGTSFLTD